ncbi:MAG: aminopeptidase P N-terminal domain-containing protein [Alphaproteobacteria bacterium]|nr:aminopeptidase P N-terminal domain-containing protein [Alphaproteobacteria bacterium]
MATPAELRPRHPELHATHRARLLDALPDGAAVLLIASPMATRSNDTEFRYRQDSDLWYLTGWEQPQAAVLLRKGHDEPFVMFVQDRNPERETWEGRRPGPEGAVSAFGADAAFAWDELATRLPDLLMGFSELHYAIARSAEHDVLVTAAIRAARRKARRSGLSVPDAFIDPARLLHELRLFKSEPELALMRKAADITVQAHVNAMAMTAPGVPEYALEAEIERTFRSNGGNGPGYTTIVGGGANATILHYIENRDDLRPDTLVCVDAGCEYDFYTADVTRTWPVSGRYTPEQRALYELVLRAELACIDLVRPGNSTKAIHDAAVRILTEGFVSLGLLAYDREAELEWAQGRDEDPPEELADDAGAAAVVDRLIETERFKRFYMHGTGHWLGIDVHDVGAYVADGESRPLQPGMVTTIEPGVYIAEDDESVGPAWRGIGIRIEDDVLCTDGDPDVLTAGAPKDPDEVAALVGTAVQQRAAR